MADVRRLYVRAPLESRADAMARGAARGMAVGSAVGAGLIAVGLVADYIYCDGFNTDDMCFPMMTALGSLFAVFAVIGGTAHGIAAGRDQPLREGWKPVALPTRVGLAPAAGGGLSVSVAFAF